MPDKPALTLDAHVHFVGDGSSGSGCWLKLGTMVRRIQGRFLLRAAGLPSRLLDGGLDEAFENLLRRLADGTELDGLVVLAQDVAYREDGSKVEDFGSFYVPNRHVFDVCRRHPKLFPACSIHPGRPDAREELELALAEGCRVLKLLPNCLNVNYASPKLTPFFERMAAGGMALLTHTGGEFTLPQFDPGLADPKLLRRPLECGVTVIAAHAAGRSGLWDPDWTADLARMTAEFPRLYCDNSALCSPNRWRTLKHLLHSDLHDRVIHGSDFPVPVGGFGPFLGGHLRLRDLRSHGSEKNPFEKDRKLKEAMGFKPETFTRLDAVTGLSRAWRR